MGVSDSNRLLLSLSICAVGASLRLNPPLRRGSFNFDLVVVTGLFARWHGGARLFWRFRGGTALSDRKGQLNCDARVVGGACTRIGLIAPVPHPHPERVGDRLNQGWNFLSSNRAALT